MWPNLKILIIRKEQKKVGVKIQQKTCQEYKKKEKYNMTLTSCFSNCCQKSRYNKIQARGFLLHSFGHTKYDAIQSIEE